MTEWTWVAMAVVHALHDRQLAEHGGLSGIRDQGALESAFARPVTLAGYG
ncbi:MAG: type II toxin-antitoxin system death-on-curing family toxin, partial [Rhizobiaceae bacterium]